MSQTTKILKFQRGFENERSAFEELAPEVRERYDEVFVAVHRGEVVDSDADFQALVARFFERYGDAPVYFGYVGQRKPILRVSSPYGSAVNANVPNRIGSVQFLPPAPAVDLRVSQGSSVETVEALIDSGADSDLRPGAADRDVGASADFHHARRRRWCSGRESDCLSDGAFRAGHIAIENFPAIAMPIQYATIGRDLE